MTHIAIIGAGIAGTSLTHWILQQQTDVTITLVDSKQPMSGSNGPTMLCHPFPGRSLAPHPNLSEAIESTVSILKEWQEHFPTLIRNVAMWRPLKGSNAQRLSQSFEDWWTENGKSAQRNSWTKNRPTIRYLSNTEVESHPSHRTPFRTLSTEPAFAIDAQELFPQVHLLLEQKGVVLHSQKVTRIARTPNGQWTLHSERSSIVVDKVILALGRHSTTWFPNLKITTQGGSLMRSTPMGVPSTTKTPALSLDGLHLGTHHSGDWVYGSTRWTVPPNDPNVEKEALSQRLRETLPQSPKMKPHSDTIWSGIRTIYASDRLPLAGELSHHKNVFVLTALGSKGWLWGPWAARGLAQTILNKKTPIGFSLFNVQRASSEDGWYSPLISEQEIPYS